METIKPILANNLSTPEMLISIWVIIWIFVSLAILKFMLDRRLSWRHEKIEKYIKKKYFFSIKEKEFFILLSNIITKNYPEKYIIFPKVRILDFLDINKGLDRSNYYRYLRKVSQKHVDFSIFDSWSYSPALVIELNWASHYNYETWKRDVFVKEVFDSINIPFVTFKNDDILDNFEFIEKTINNFLSETKQENLNC